MKSLEIVERVFNELSLKYPSLTTLLVDVCMKVYEAIGDEEMLLKTLSYLEGFRHGMNYTMSMTVSEKTEIFRVLQELEIEVAAAINAHASKR